MRIGMPTPIVLPESGAIASYASRLGFSVLNLEVWSAAAPSEFLACALTVYVVPKDSCPVLVHVVAPPLSAPTTLCPFGSVTLTVVSVPFVTLTTIGVVGCTFAAFAPGRIDSLAGVAAALLPPPWLPPPCCPPPCVDPPPPLEQ